MSEGKPTLDYLSPAQETTLERRAEDSRTQAVENYNEATFGEARPIASAWRRLAIYLIVAVATMTLLPRSIGRPLRSMECAAFVAWELKSNGWRPRRSIGRSADG